MLFPCKHYPQSLLLTMCEVREAWSCREPAGRRLLQGIPDSIQAPRTLLSSLGRDQEVGSLFLGHVVTVAGFSWDVRLLGLGGDPELCISSSGPHWSSCGGAGL